MNDTPEQPQPEPPLTEAQRRAAEREARVAAKLRENLRRRKAAARKQKQESKSD